MKKNIKLFIGLILSFSLSISCTSTPPIEYAITIVSNGSLADNKDELLPQEVKVLMQINNCSSRDTIFIPKLSVFRKDLEKNNKEEINIPTGFGNDVKKKMGTYGIADMQNDLAEHLPTMKAGMFLTKKGQSKNISYSHKRDALVFNLGENTTFNSVARLKKHIDSLICSGNDHYSKEIVIVLNEEGQEISDGTGNGVDEESSEISDPCNASTVSDGLNLKDDLLTIIDTNNSYEERDLLSKTVWDKYFDEMASVKMYIKPDQKSPEGIWESGDGQNYFIDRLAFMNSITDINITRIEYHRETKKITGIVIVECHNASQIQ